MENEPTTTTLNGDNTDAHSQVNGGAADNLSRHSSRVGSAKSGRSKAASVREAVNIDEIDGRKPTPPIANGSPRPEQVTNGDQHPSAVAKTKPPSPVVPAFDAPNGDHHEDLNDQDDDRINSEVQAIVSLSFHREVFLKDFYLVGLYS